MANRIQTTKKRTTVDMQQVAEQLTEVAVMPNPIWKRKGAMFYAFSPTQDENGIRSVIELTMKGTVVKSFLRAGALSHTVSIDASKEDIEALKSFIRTAPGFDEQYYRWPSDGNRIKFTSKRDLDLEFKFVWNGIGVNWSNIEERKRMAVEEVKEGTTVVVEYTPMAYMGKNATDNMGGFESGCSLQLLSVGVLSESDSKEFDFDSPRKRMRMAE
jgi:hypothetical protein